MAEPWYLFPVDNPGGGYGQLLDPYCARCGCCSYLKPDTNIAIPQGTPITALRSGVVTDVTDHGGGAGGLSVVIKDDNPINSVATHEAYNFLGSSSVHIGQRIQAGEQIGKAGSPYGINFALALTPDNTWGGQSFDLNARGDPRLNPMQLLSPARAGQPLPQGAAASGGGGTDLSGLPFGIGGAIGALEQSFVNLSEEVGIFVLALLLIILGVILLASRQIRDVGNKALKAGEIAAIA